MITVLATGRDFEVLDERLKSYLTTLTALLVRQKPQTVSIHSHNLKNVVEGSEYKNLCHFSSHSPTPLDYWGYLNVFSP